MDKKLLSMLVCPVCKGKLIVRAEELWCVFDRLAYPIIDGIPVMLEQSARSLTLEETES